MYFMDLQEAANVFENFTTKYRKTTHGKEQSGVDELRTESIFKVAVAFEKVVLSYGKYHLSGTKSSKTMVGDNISECLHGCLYRFVIIDHLFSNCLTNQESEWLSNWLVDLLTEWLTLTDCLSEALGEWMTSWFHDRKKVWMNLFVNFMNLTVTYININFFSFLSKVLGIQKVYGQNASNFYLKKHEWQESINISSGNFADNGLYTLPLYFYIQYPLILWLISVLLNNHQS